MQRSFGALLATTIALASLLPALAHAQDPCRYERAGAFTEYTFHVSPFAQDYRHQRQVNLPTGRDSTDRVFGQVDGVFVVSRTDQEPGGAIAPEVQKVAQEMDAMINEPNAAARQQLEREILGLVKSDLPPGSDVRFRSLRVTAVAPTEGGYYVSQPTPVAGAPGYVITMYATITSEARTVSGQEPVLVTSDIRLNGGGVVSGKNLILQVETSGQVAPLPGTALQPVKQTKRLEFRRAQIAELQRVQDSLQVPHALTDTQRQALCSGDGGAITTNLRFTYLETAFQLPIAIQAKRKVTIAASFGE